MNPDLFPLLNADTIVKNLLGVNPLRVFPYGKAPQPLEYPYAVYTVISAQPENYLADRPDVDLKSVQMSIYAKTNASLESCYNAVVDVLEEHAYMVNFSTPDIDAKTDLYSCRMEFDFYDAR